MSQQFNLLQVLEIISRGCRRIKQSCPTTKTPCGINVKPGRNLDNFISDIRDKYFSLQIKSCALSFNKLVDYLTVI